MRKPHAVACRCTAIAFSFEDVHVIAWAMESMEETKRGMVASSLVVSTAAARMLTALLCGVLR